MASIRARLTTGYAVALVGTLAVFAGALYAARRANVYREIERYLGLQAEQALRIVREARDSGEPLTVVRDSLIGPTVAPRLRTMLEGVPEYVIV
ncbi:MAG TPA: hypothetical protein VF034_08145, partial [Gemmatimonadaceae bacterium]